MESKIPYSESIVSLVASILTVVLEYNSFEVTYLPEIVVVRFKTSARFEVPPVNTAFSIVILELSLSQLEPMPSSASASIKS